MRPQESLCRKIEVDEQIGMARAAPGRCLPCRLPEDPLVQPMRHSRLQGDRHESSGREATLRGVVPADQRLEAGDTARDRDDERLVLHHELPLLEGPVQVDFQLQPSNRFPRRRRVEQAVSLRGVPRNRAQGRPCVIQQLLSLFVPGARFRDTEGRVQHDRVAVERDGRFDDADHSCGELLAALGLRVG